jgi:(2S)-methylsuccinyl-CoA dehydrogenase
MSQAAEVERHADSGLEVADLLETCRSALKAAQALEQAAEAAVARLVAPEGKVEGKAVMREQFAAHGYAWLATYVATLKETLAWADRLEAEGALREQERLILQIGFGEYLAQMAGGIAMSQGEIVRPEDMDVAGEAIDAFTNAPSVKALVRGGNSNAARMRLCELIVERFDQRDFGQPAFGDETLDMVADQFRKVADAHAWDAHEWHLKDDLIPMEVVNQLAELGVFGLTIPEEHGGLGMGKTAMCVVTEELSRGYIGLGSLGTRSEIAAELIRLGGTEAQKEHYLPRIASGEILPTAVFTEPNVGSDLGSLKTRAVRDGDSYKIIGNKTWTTHGARSDLMTLLARTDPNESGWRGLSMFLAEKPRGDDDHPFPAKGMTGGEIEVLGYRGMKEYEIAFDEFEVPSSQLLGGVEGTGFKQLMATFESARVQTAARAVGVAQNALELATGYAIDRQQFGRSIVKFPRVGGKLAFMAVETMMARQLTLAAAREKDEDRRCDIEAGMSKLLAARVAWSAADNAVQVHGGNGYALEYPISRVLCDARILNVFEGAAEIQAQVIARGLIANRVG